jgi:CubicO group peptidase (beta-lactamase class C family)
MKYLKILATLVLGSWGFISPINAQALYFPPLTGNSWETVPPESLGWCTDRLDAMFQFLDSTDTKAFLILKDGRIAVEQYFGQFTRDSFWYWASAGKTLTAFLVGQAQEDNLLDIDDPTSNYLGTGWTALPPEKEALISIRDQLAMTSGLRDGTADDFCTLPACLTYQADAGTRWAYHNAPYTLLTNVLGEATGQNLNTLFFQKIRNRLGMRGIWLPQGYNQIYLSDARSMARFGLMMLNRGVWATDTLMRDTAYFQAMVNTSQNLNPAYGYLWWLNGKEFFKVPGSQLNFPGKLIPNAPDDLIAALGANDQKLYIIPSMNMVIVRLGQDAGGFSLSLSGFDNALWSHLMALFCNVNSAVEITPSNGWHIFPNPTHGWLQLMPPLEKEHFEYRLFNSMGQILTEGYNATTIDLAAFPAGTYFLALRQGAVTTTQKIVLLPR